MQLSVGSLNPGASAFPAASTSASEAQAVQRTPPSSSAFWKVNIDAGFFCVR